jgi:RNA polymerase sigma factor (TIGR02999 family)
MSDEQDQVTRLLLDWSKGDGAAFDELVPLVHDELRRLARRYMRRERAGHTLQTTALVNEAYLRLINQGQVEWQNRAHFFAIAARVMRRILVDYARTRGYSKRGGNAIHVSFDETAVVSPGAGAEIIAIDEALGDLAAVDPRKGRIVELRFFGGLSIEETAEVMSISPTTVQREWRSAKAWLYYAISGEKINEA